jgi:hypothetical protein
MEAYQELQMVLHQAATLDGVRQSVEGLKELLHLSRRDQHCMRGVLACRMLQLDQDQECFDFIKWFELRAYDHSRIAYNWHDMRLPYMNPTKSSLLSSISFLDIDRTEPVFLTSVLLLKIKLVIDVKNIILARRLLRHQQIALSLELIELICYQSVRSPASQAFVRLPDNELMKAKSTLCAHVVQLGKAIVRKTSTLTNTLVNHVEFFKDPCKSVPKKIRSDYISMLAQGIHPMGLDKGFDEHILTFNLLYPAIVQTDEVFDLLRKTNATAKARNVKPNGMWRFFPAVIDDACALLVDRE